MNVNREVGYAVYKIVCLTPQSCGLFTMGNQGECVERTHSLEGGQEVTATHGLGASMAWRVVVVVVTASSHAFLF